MKYNDLMSEKHRALNYFKHFLVFASAVTACASISAFASVVGVPVVLIVFWQDKEFVH